MKLFSPFHPAHDFRCTDSTIGRQRLKVNYYLKCSLLSEMFIIIWNVHYYPKCSLLSEMFIIIWNVHCYLKCSLLSEMFIIIWKVYCYLKCSLLSKMESQSWPTKNKRRISFQVRWIFPAWLLVERAIWDLLFKYISIVNWNRSHVARFDFSAHGFSYGHK